MSGEIVDKLEPWENKAHDIVARYCHRSWIQGKRQPGYSVPAIAHALVRALGIVDDRSREHEVKRLFEVERLGAWTLI